MSADLVGDALVLPGRPPGRKCSCETGRAASTKAQKNRREYYYSRLQGATWLFGIELGPRPSPPPLRLPAATPSHYFMCRRAVHRSSTSCMKLFGDGQVLATSSHAAFLSPCLQGFGASRQLLERCERCVGSRLNLRVCRCVREHVGLRRGSRRML